MPFQIGPHNRATSRLTLQQSTCWREGSGSRFPILDLKNLTKQRSSIWGELPELRSPRAREHCYYKANRDRGESPSPLQHLKSHRKRALQWRQFLHIHSLLIDSAVVTTLPAMLSQQLLRAHLTPTLTLALRRFLAFAGLSRSVRASSIRRVRRVAFVSPFLRAFTRA